MTPEEIQDRILYRDAMMLVIDKPAGIPVHKGPKGGAVLEDYFPALGFDLPNAPALAHRLDRETSGCLVLGRHRKALADLGRLFRRPGAVGKAYLALLEGRPPDEHGEVDLPLARRDPKRGWFMKVDRAAGQPALSRYRVIGESGGMALALLEPVTGRTHQLRLHMAALGCPILGERIYAPAPAPASVMLHLHARMVSVPLYPGLEPVRVTAPLPPHIVSSLHALGLAGRLEDAEISSPLQPLPA